MKAACVKRVLPSMRKKCVPPLQQELELLPGLWLMGCLTAMFCSRPELQSLLPERAVTQAAFHDQRPIPMLHRSPVK